MFAIYARSVGQGVGNTSVGPGTRGKDTANPCSLVFKISVTPWGGWTMATGDRGTRRYRQGRTHSACHLVRGILAHTDLLDASRNRSDGFAAVPWVESVSGYNAVVGRRASSPCMKLESVCPFSIPG